MNIEIEDNRILDLNTLTVDELKNIAKEKGLEGYSSLKKADLIELIESV